MSIPKLIKPTVGRVLWFFPRLEWATAEGIVYVPGEPLAATIARVWGDRMVNLAFVDASGVSFNATSIKLLQENDAPPDGDHFAMWMPYQNGQAAKTEEVEKKLGDAIDSLLTTRIPILDQITDLVQTIEMCPGSPSLTDAVRKANDLRKPISELVRQALDLGIGAGILSESPAPELVGKKCLACGESHGDSGLPCPKMVATASIGKAGCANASVRLFLNRNTTVTIAGLPLRLEHDTVVLTHPANVPLLDLAATDACKSERSD